MNNRRRLVAAIGAGILTFPSIVFAQRATKVYRIGFLGPAPASSYAPRVEGLRSGLRNLGYAEGKNFEFEFRWAERVSQLPELAAELVRLNVDLIFASSSTQVGPAWCHPTVRICQSCRLKPQCLKQEECHRSGRPTCARSRTDPNCPFFSEPGIRATRPEPRSERSLMPG